MCNNDYPVWRQQFEAFINYTEPDLMLPLLSNYIQPRPDVLNRENRVKLMSEMTPEERTLYDREKKAYTVITMRLPQDVFSAFKDLKTAHDLWNGLKK